MTFDERLKELKSKIKFLALNDDFKLGELFFPKNLYVPISSDGYAKDKSGKEGFVIKDVLQNMLLAVALFDDLPLKDRYELILKNLFDKSQEELIYALLDLQNVDDDLKKAGILRGFAKFKPDFETYLQEGKAFFLLYESLKDDFCLDMAEKAFVKSNDLKVNSEASYFLSFIYHFKGDYIKAYDYANKVLDNSPTEEMQARIESQFKYIESLKIGKEAEDLLRKGSYDKVIELLEKDDLEKSHLSERILGEAYLNLNEPYQSIEHLKSALEFEMADAYTHNLIGQACVVAGDISNATRFFESAVKLEPGNTTYIKDIADIYMRTGKAETALKLIDKAISMDPDNEDLEEIKLRLADRFKR